MYTPHSKWMLTFVEGINTDSLINLTIEIKLE